MRYIGDFYFHVIYLHPEHLNSEKLLYIQKFDVYFHLYLKKYHLHGHLLHPSEMWIFLKVRIIHGIVYNFKSS